MPRRRMRFAAPLVIVTTTSCGQPAPAQEPEPPVVIEGLDYVRKAEAARGDAGVDEGPVRADILRFVTIVIPEHTVQPPKGRYISCHNFGPGNSGCNPPRPYYYAEQRLMRRILAGEPTSDGLAVTIAIEKDDAIERGMSVSRSGVRIGHVDEVGKRSARLVIQLSEGEDLANATIELHAVPKAEDPPPVAAPVVMPVNAEIIAAEESGSGVVISLAAGKEDGIDRGWIVEVTDGRHRPVRNGRAVVFKVLARTAYAKVKLTRDQVTKHAVARLSPPSSE